MPNGTGGRRAYDYNPGWCEDKHHKIDEEIKGIWGDHGFGAVWKRMDKVEAKLWTIIVGLALNFGGIITLLLKIIFDEGGI